MVAETVTADEQVRQPRLPGSPQVPSHGRRHDGRGDTREVVARDAPDAAAGTAPVL
ncbi:hypothetical protein Acsp04_50630 [Actinomadura sp. NBRC 104425]|uniref:hypothetical protein n=1 Tax=Actinomadura sp. NBRC 104425 TaxID=3032204 RepID=UPI0024A2F9F1|nr:hypothetical protein [Actinomadura sp. NBRC 104425]GLZ14828.1 hypothetical protein Acsp04_50630 [Actinomadura sp. NBRC 104425]